MPAIVYVWPNNPGLLGARGHPGHASVAVRELQQDQLVRQLKVVSPTLPIGMYTANEIYISWWPAADNDYEEKFVKNQIRPLARRTGTANTATADRYSEMSARTRANLTNNVFLPTSTQRRKRDDRGDEDWVQLPTYKEKVPLQHENPRRLGLNKHLMVAWWKFFLLDEGARRTDNPFGFSAPLNVYRFASRHNNCASIAGMALETGGASWFIRETSKRKLPNWSTFVTMPMDVYRYTLMVKDGIAELQQLANTLFAGQTNLKVSAPTLMSCEEWVKLSNQRVGFFARRREQTAAIDTLLRKYHTLGDGLPDWSKKMDCMFAMLWEIWDHLRTKPTSDRKHAMVQLAYRLFDTIKYSCNTTLPALLPGNPIP
jgi:hypothetical protein